MQTFVTFTLCIFLLSTAVLRIKEHFSGDLHLGISVDQILMWTTYSDSDGRHINVPEYSVD